MHRANCYSDYYLLILPLQKEAYPSSVLPPILPYRRDNLSELAEQVIRSQITVPGVQPKLSLDLEEKDKNTPQRFTIVGLWGKYILKP